jgi:hypothetical protein
VCGETRTCANPILTSHYVCEYQTVTEGTANGLDVSSMVDRLRALEKEKMALMVENGKQRQQYERCLDDVTSQVVHVLLAQKVIHFTSFETERWKTPIGIKILMLAIWTPDEWWNEFFMLQLMGHITEHCVNKI